MQPGSWAPAHVCYGAGDRSVLVRIPEKRRTRRFEYRGADGICNPYLLAACLVAAGLHGIQNQMDPGEPADIDVSRLSDMQLKEKGITWTPRSLKQALDYLAEDTILAETIGRSIWEEFIKIKRTEWDKYSRYVSEWERSIFSSRF
jgi:glutamine synthetase